MAQLSNESSPLLPSSSTKQPTPLPKAQLFSLCLIRLVEPIAFSQVFPYINPMMADLHLPGGPSRVALYSGLAESAFAVSSLFSIYHWARLSDVIGRRPVIFIGILGMNLATLLFGLQRTFVGLLLVRCLGGFFSGNVAVVYSVLGELTDSTNQAIAFPIFSLAWPVGSIIGPLIGGTFSNPASTFPNFNLFHHNLFRAYPYFLPGCIASAVSLIGVILGCVLLEETLPSKRRGLSIREVDQRPRSAPCTLKMLVSVPIIRAISLSGAGLSFTYTAFDVLFVLFCYSPIESGGLALSPTDIGLCLAMSGIASCVIQLFVTPVLIARCDHIRAYNRCISLWPFCFLAFPLLNIVARIGFPKRQMGTSSLHLTDADCHIQAIVWCGIITLLALSRLGSVAFGLSMILVKETAPNPESLGATNGLVQFAMSFARSICPAFASLLFGLLASGKFPSGYLWVIVMAGISYAWTLLGNQLERNRESFTVPCDGLCGHE